MPHYHALSENIRNVWDSIGRSGPSYVLIGGTALAYLLGHRVSQDIDLATSRPAEHPNALRRKWDNDLIGKHKWLRRSPDHYIKFFPTDQSPKIDVHGKVRGGCLELPRLASNGLRISSITDILRQKLTAMCFREEERDGKDVAAILESGAANVEQAVAGLRDERLMMGVGDVQAAILGERLQDLAHSPWHAYSSIRTLAEPLTAESWARPRPACERIEGPDEVGPIADGSPAPAFPRNSRVPRLSGQ